MSRTARLALMALLDVAVLSVAYWGAFLLRFDGHLSLWMFKRALFAWPYVVAFQYFVLYLFSVPRFAWRFISLREAYRIGGAVGLVAGVLLVARLVSGLVRGSWGYAAYALVPIGVILAYAAFAFIGVVGIRALRRLTVENADRGRRARAQTGGPESVRTLLVGAGQAGALTAKEILARPDLRMEIVGFLDDLAAKKGSTIHGVPILGSSDELAKVAHRTGATQVIITIASATGQQIRRIVELCERAGIQPKIIPGIYEILDGSVQLSRIRDVSIEDLLGREPVELDLDLVSSFVAAKVVLVTGAGGSIGSELCRQVARFGPKRLVLLEQAEFGLFTIHQELSRTHPEIDLGPVICDVCDAARVASVFAEEQPQVVFHAAAHKHVPMMEWNPGEAVKNNVFGTKTVADAANHHGAEAFVMVSTDKAVNPTSVMGATKRVAEMYIQALSSGSSTKFVAVRFGNVLGSTGSVVPTFKAQIADGGPVTVTHEEMKRYFMTIPEASQLVMQAAAMGEGGEIFVLDMGEPVRIVDLAQALIRLSGFEPGVDIAIEFTGLRPGEKLFEEFGFDAERMTKTRHEKIYVGRLAPSRLEVVEEGLGMLSEFRGLVSVRDVRVALARIVPEMQNSAPSVRPGPAVADATPPSQRRRAEADGMAAVHLGLASR